MFYLFCQVHKRLHSGDKPYECDFCGRPFRQWGDLKYHIQSRHTAEKNHQCEFCGKDFARRYSLVVHRRIHTGEKNYKCEHCDKEFRASSYLQVHRKIHTGKFVTSMIWFKPYELFSLFLKGKNLIPAKFVGRNSVFVGI